MIIRQFLHQEPIGISYLFGCGGRAAGAVVDPVGPLEPYLRAAEAAGMRIHFVIDTHVHADHLSVGRRLAKAAGAEYVLAAHAQVSFSFRGARDEEVLPLGNVAAKVLHTHSAGTAGGRRAQGSKFRCDRRGGLTGEHENPGADDPAHHDHRGVEGAEPAGEART
jgi:hypothetical protein